MTIYSRDFGVLELNEEEILRFVSPIFGFEDLTDFVLLSDDETGPGLLWLQSVEKTDVCFVLLDPQEIGFEYAPEIPQDTKKILGVEDDYEVRIIAVVPADFKKTTVNLKSPIFFNLKKKCAAQVVLEGDYPIKKPLFDEEGEQC